ncbi:NotI family restriction endonuclease [Streptosporangium sp. NPDC000095]|uniref:NotI family restriction endonuclease n=1 Tax=Streptosporangium sp. NPDC000095 TaxID=3366184 RepID=UPI00369D7F8B
MAATIYEFFGFRPHDMSATAVQARHAEECPFLKETCEKTLNDGKVSGVCTLKPITSGPVICCPIRLYADDYKILREVADMAFDQGLSLHPGASARYEAMRSGRPTVAVFGKKWGGELRLPQRGGSGAYFVDWILAVIEPSGQLREFVAIEVQSIDTTGNYRDGIAAIENEEVELVKTSAGFNWENVSKRILPQLIYKGHALQREPLCKKGLFFVCPQPVYARINKRLGAGDRRNFLDSYPLQSGSLTFVAFDIDAGAAFVPGESSPLRQTMLLSTITNQVAIAFTSPANLPEPGSYAAAIREALS